MARIWTSKDEEDEFRRCVCEIMRPLAGPQWLAITGQLVALIVDSREGIGRDITARVAAALRR